MRRKERGQEKRGQRDIKGKEEGGREGGEE